MKHSGKALIAALKLLAWTLLALLGSWLVGFLATTLGALILKVWIGLLVLWVLSAVFSLYFFRDPHPVVPAGSRLIVAPAHGTVDLVDEANEPEFVGGPCRRVSTFLSVLDVHVQKAPVAGRIAFVRHTPGQFLNAMRTESAAHNENVLIGIESGEVPGEKIGVRLIAGLIARRIVPWVVRGDTVSRGERISLIQFGSRVDLYLPLSVKLQVKPGDRMRGGETIVATRD